MAAEHTAKSAEAFFPHRSAGSNKLLWFLFSLSSRMYARHKLIFLLLTNKSTILSHFACFCLVFLERFLGASAPLEARRLRAESGSAPGRLWGGAAGGAAGGA